MVACSRSSSSNGEFSGTMSSALSNFEAHCGKMSNSFPAPAGSVSVSFPSLGWARDGSEAGLREDVAAGGDVHEGLGAVHFLEGEGAHELGPLRWRRWWIQDLPPSFFKNLVKLDTTSHRMHSAREKQPKTPR